MSEAGAMTFQDATVHWGLTRLKQVRKMVLKCGVVCSARDWTNKRGTKG